MTKLNKMEQVVLGAIIMHPEGATQDDIGRALSTHYPTANFTARFASLKRKQLIADTGVRRVGSLGRNQSVLKATVFSQ